MDTRVKFWLRTDNAVMLPPPVRRSTLENLEMNDSASRRVTLGQSADGTAARERAELARQRETRNLMAFMITDCGVI